MACSAARAWAMSAPMWAEALIAWVSHADTVNQRPQRVLGLFRLDCDRRLRTGVWQVVMKFLGPTNQQPVGVEDGVQACDKVRLRTPYRLLDLSEQVATDVHELAEPGQRHSTPLPKGA